jgi:hypothetical protein
MHNLVLIVMSVAAALGIIAYLRCFNCLRTKLTDSYKQFGRAHL